MTHTEPPAMVARCPEDLLAMVPVTLGFDPHESVVMLTFGGARPFQARLDLPPCRDEVPQTVASLLDPAAAHRVGQVAFVLYTGDETLAGRLWRALRDGCRSADLEVVAALRAHEGRWYPLLHGDRLTREIGIAYDVSAHPFVAHSVLRGQVTHASRAALEATLDPDPARVAGVLAVVGAETGPPATASPAQVRGWVEELLATHRSGGRPDDAAAGRLLRALRDPALRDAAWSLVGDDAPLHVEVWSDLLRRCPHDLRAAPAFLLAWAAWRSGHGALAWCALDRVAEVEGPYPPADLLAAMLQHAVPPDDLWRPWEPGPDEDDEHDEEDEDEGWLEGWPQEWDDPSWRSA